LIVTSTILMMAGCGSPTVSGRIVDAFGNPLPDVRVSMDGTSFSTVSDDTGEYAIQFVPGQFKVRIEKDGYTTSTIELNVAEATDVPAAEVELYPMPDTSGLFYIAEDDLVPLATYSLRQEQVRANPWLPGSTRYFLKPGHPPILPEGDARFIDTTASSMQLVRATGRSGLFLDTAHRDRSEIPEATSEEVGEERLTVWRANLQAGVYGWTQWQRNILGQVYPSDEYYGFQVGDAPWFTFLGTFGADDYAVDLWRDPARGLVGHVDHPVQEADTPTGRIDNVQYDSTKGSLSFRAVVGGLGEAPNEVHEFIGEMKPEKLTGSFRRYAVDGKLLGDRTVVLEKQPDQTWMNQYDDLLSWEEDYSKPILLFRGPETESYR
jgi:hypothetical protein